MANNNKKRSEGFTAAQRLINEMVASRTVGTDYNRPSSRNTSGNAATTQSSPEAYVTKRLSQLGLDRKEVNDDFVSSFINDSRRYADEGASLNSKIGVGTSSSIYNSRKETAEDLRSRSWAISRYLEQNKESIPEEYYAALKSYLDNFDQYTSQSLYSTYRADNFYSQFDSEETYNKWLKYSTPERRQEQYEQNMARLEELKQERAAANNMPGMNPYLTGAGPNTMPMYGAALQNQQVGSVNRDIDREIAQLEKEILLYERGGTDETGFHYGFKVADDYGELRENEDFGALSANRNFQNASREDLIKADTLNDSSNWYYDANGVYRDAYGNALETDASGNWVNPNAQGYAVTDRLGLYLSASEEELQEAIGTPISMEGTWESVIKDGYDGNWELLTKDEVDIYYYLLNTSGQNTADKYLSDMKVELNRRNTQNATTRYTEAFDEATALERLAMSIATTPAQMISGAAGFIENTAMTMMGKDINPYSAAYGGMNFSSTVRSKQAQAFDDATGGIAIPFINFTAGDLYQAGMSAFDMAVGGRLGAGAYEALMGMSAASSEAKRLYEQGATQEQITWGGALAGASEMVFEHASIENLINLKDADTVGQLIKNILIQGGIEASEEGFTEIANTITNAIVMGDASDWAKLVAEKDGDILAALISKAQDVGAAAFGGFVSGGFGGSAVSAASYAQTQAQNAELGEYISGANSTDALVALAQEMAGGVSGRDQKRLTSQSERIGKDFLTEGGKNRAAGRLYNTVRSVVTDQNISEISSALQEKGFSKKDATAIAGAVAVQASGMELSDKQQKVLEKFGSNETVKSVLDEVLGNEESGINQRAKSIAKFEFGAMRNYITSQAEKALAEQKNAPDADKVDAQEEEGAEGSYEVSAEGKTILKSTGEIVNIQDVADIRDGKMILRLDNGSTVDSSEVSYASQDEALIYETVAQMGASVKAANILVNGFKSAEGLSASAYAHGIEEAFRYGKLGVPVRDLATSTFASKLNAGQQEYVYRQGQKAAGKQVAKEQAAVRKNRTVAESATVGKEGRSYQASLEGNISVSSLNESQKASYQLADQIAEAAKVNIRVYAGKTGEQGYYDPKTDEIYLNLNATNQSKQSMMAFTLGHELVHRAKKGAPAKYKAFANFLMEEYGKQGSNVEDMIAQELAAAKRFKIKMSYEQAFEEVVCDACQRMLLDTDAGKKLAEFGAQSKQNKSFLEDLKRWIKEFLDKLRSIFEGVEPDSLAAKEFAKFDQNVKQILADMYVDMTIDAGENLSTIHSVVKENAKAISSDEIITDGAVVTDGSEIKYSIKSMKADIAEGQMFEDLKTFCGWTQKQVDELKKNLQDLVAYMTPYRDILDMNETYGREGRRFSPYKPNSDPLYKISMDFSTLCSKRLLTQYVIENLQLRENRPMSAEEQMAIRHMLNEYRKVEKGLQVACAMCYVEAARLKSPKQIQKWMDDPATAMRNYFADKNPEFAAYIKEKQSDFKESRGYARNATKKDISAKDVRELNKIRPRLRSQYQVSAEEEKIIERAKALPNSTYLTAANLANLSETDPVIYSAYTAFVRTATRSKSLETDEPYYYGDSNRDNGNGIVVSDSFIEEVNRENGMRFSSWSDWRIQHLLDYITAVIDNSVRGAAMHGYTKFGEEVRVLGKTGMMFNMSGVAGTQTGLNEDGSLSFSPTESIDVNEAIQLRDEFPETAGLQCIGVGDDHIVALLRSDIIDYVIPYHVSGLNAGLRAMANIQGWQDYTTTQHAAIDKSMKLAEAKDQEHWHEEPVFSEFFVGYGTGMSGIEAMKESAKRYVQMCKDRGLRPKFEQFVKEENYWKLLVDRKMINQKTGKLIQQKAVTPTFDFGTIKEVVDQYVQNYDSGLEARALNHIVENWDSIPKHIRDLKKQGSKKAKKASKAVDTLANQTLAAQPADDQKVYSLPKNPYSYDNLISKPDMVVTTVGGNVPKNRADVVYMAKQNAAKVGKVDPKSGSVSVYVKDIGRDVGIGRDGLKHSIDRRIDVNAPVLLKAGEIISNSIRVNELTPKKDRIDESYVLIGAARNAANELYVVRSVVNRFSHNLVSMDVLYAINAKKEPAALLPLSTGKPALGTDSTITIAELLDYVNQYFPDILPEEVLKHYGHDARPEGELGEAALYKLPVGEDTSPRALLANAFEGVAKNDIERNKIREYKEKISLINAEEKKLQSLNKQLKKETDPKKIRELQFDIMQTSNRINTYDRQLLRLEASKPLQDVLTREKKMAYDRGAQKAKEALEAYRERAEKEHQEIIDRYQESRKRGVENRQKTAMRQKIRKVIRDLDKILNRGDKKRNVKEDLKDFVADALATAEVLFTDNYRNEDMVWYGVSTEMTPEEAKLMSEARAIMEEISNLPTGYEGWQARQETEEKLKSRLNYRMAKLRDVFVRERARLNKTQVSEVLGNLADSYAKLQNSEYAHVQGAYHEAVHEYLKMLQEDVGGTVIKDMTLGQLEELYKAYTMVKTTVYNANRMFADNLNTTRDALANRVMFEVHEAGGEHGLWSKAGDKLNSFFWNNEKPVYAFERIGSKTLKTLYGNIRKGQDGWAINLQEANNFRMAMYNKYQHSTWDTLKTYKFTSSSGIDFELNTDQIMSLYAYSKRAQAHDHLLKGGFVFDGNTEVVVNKKGLKMTYLNKNATAYNLSFEILEQIISKLTAEQKAFVDEMQEYLSTTMGEKGNEVSMELYGVKLFNEKFYFPLRSAGQYMERAKEADLKKEQGQINIANSGFSKAIKIHASNPVVLSGFMDVWAGHVNEMSMYHSFVLPMEDFRRVYNYSSPHMEGQQSASVNGVIQNAYGAAATDYIDKLYRDLNGGAITDNTTGPLNWFLSRFKKGAVFASASVVIQQPSAIARASALIDLKHFDGYGVGTLPKMGIEFAVQSVNDLVGAFGVTKTTSHDKEWAELKKYAPVTIIKEMGFFDTNMGRSAKDFLTAEEYSSIKEKAQALVKDESYRDELLSKAPALADEVTWCAIWRAVKRETKARHPGMNVKSEEFLKLAGERFSEVIDKTQVYDSVLARSANMRSKDTGMKMVTAFMAEPTTSANMVADALRKGKKGNKKYARRVIGSVVASVILNSILVSIVQAARDDDEEKSYAEKYIKSLTSEIIDGLNPATYIPFLKDIVSIVQGYDVERSDMSVVSDLVNAVRQLFSDKVTGWKKVEGFVGSVFQIFGLPVKNIMRDVRSMYQAFDTIINGENTTMAGIKYAVKEGFTGKSVSNPEQLYEARLAGDDEHAARVEARYDDEDSANASVRQAIKGSYLNGDIDTATAQKHLILYAGEDAGEARWLTEEWKHEADTGEEFGRYNEFYEAVETGKNLKAVIKEYNQKGVDSEALSEQITRHYKPEYIKMSASERANIKGYLLNALEQCGVDREDAEERLADWDFEAKYDFSYSNRKEAYLNGEVSVSELRTALITVGGYTEEDADLQIEAYNWEADGYDGVTLAAVREYNEHCAVENVPKDVYLYIRSFSNNTENDVDEVTGKTIYYSAMKKVIAEIDAQTGLTPAQKTAIARCLGWSDKNINKYKTW